MTSKLIVFAAALAAANVAAAQNRTTLRFAEMDRNRDGVITRDEWRGSARSFTAQDSNRDGVLSEDEVRRGNRQARRRTADTRDDNAFNDWTERGFEYLDRNNDGRVSRDEWQFDREGFSRADHNGDGVITRSEFLNETTPAADEPPATLFDSVDVNHDRVVSRDEWHWSRGSFDARDRNRDGRISRDEFDATSSTASQSPAYNAGYQRGLAEGRQAGIEDHGPGRVWDLEGQRELETADSGYQTSMGPLADYQAGYRAAFRRAYRDGWNSVR